MDREDWEVLALRSYMEERSPREPWLRGRVRPVRKALVVFAFYMGLGSPVFEYGYRWPPLAWWWHWMGIV